MVIFHSYVSLPVGRFCSTHFAKSARHLDGGTLEDGRVYVAWQKRFWRSIPEDVGDGLTLCSSSNIPKKESNSYENWLTLLFTALFISVLGFHFLFWLHTHIGKIGVLRASLPAPLITNPFSLILNTPTNPGSVLDFILFGTHRGYLMIHTNFLDLFGMSVGGCCSPRLHIAFGGEHL